VFTVLIFLSAFWSSKLWPESLIKFCLQHSRIPLTLLSKRLQFPPTNHLQRLKNHMARFNHSNDCCHSWYQFSVLVRLHFCDKIPQRNFSEVSVYSPWLNLFWDHSEARHHGGRSMWGWLCYLVFSFSPLMLFGPPAYGMVQPTFRADTPPLVTLPGNSLTDTPRGVLYSPSRPFSIQPSWHTRVTITDAKFCQILFLQQLG
jgi:hypothetical protein